MYFLRNLLLSFAIVPWAYAAIANEYKVRHDHVDGNGVVRGEAIALLNQPADGLFTRSSAKGDRNPVLNRSGGDSAVLAISYESWKSGTINAVAEAGDVRPNTPCHAFQSAPGKEASTLQPEPVRTKVSLFGRQKAEHRIEASKTTPAAMSLCLGQDLFAQCEREGACNTYGVLVRYDL